MKTRRFVQNNGMLRYTVKEEFFTKMSDKGLNPEDFNTIKLFAEHHIHKYLHNPVGPAVKILLVGFKERVPFDGTNHADPYQYWFNGVITAPEKAKRIIFDNQFSSDLTDLINNAPISTEPSEDKN
jgi:hypothetical protein